MFMFGSEGWEWISLDEDSIYLSLDLSLKVKGVLLGEEFLELVFVGRGD